MDIKGGCRQSRTGMNFMEIRWWGAYLQIADAKKVSRQKGCLMKSKTCWYPNVHLVGVRRMSFLTVLLLFFSRSSLHDRTFEKTMFAADESVTGSNNITLIVTCTLLSSKVSLIRDASYPLNCLVLSSTNPITVKLFKSCEQITKLSLLRL